MTRLSPAELRAICIANPDFAARNAHELRKLAGTALNDDVRKLNPGVGSISSATVDAADILLAHIRTLAPDLAQPIRDYPFDRFRIDLAWPSALLAVEVDGGQWKAGGGKHGGKRDYQKTRRITQAGWRLLRFTASEVSDNPIGVIEEIRAALA